MKKGEYIIIGMALLLLVFLLAGCKSVQYVPVPEYHNIYVEKTDTFVQRDSIYHADSVIVEKNGDTITIQKTKILYRDRWRDQVVRDSFVKNDSILVPYPVERKLTEWECFCIDYGKVTLGGTLMLFVAAILWLILWMRRHSFI